MKFDPINFNRNKTGHVIWITGLSGAGKTTLAKKLFQRFESMEIPSLLLDGDILRNILSEDQNAKSYTFESRKIMAKKYSRLSLFLASQGYCVITSVIGMFKEIYEWNSNNLPGYFEIFLDIPIVDLKKNDSKGIYKKFELGHIKNVAGLDLKIQKPKNPHIHIKNREEIKIDSILFDIVNRLSIKI